MSAVATMAADLAPAGAQPVTLTAGPVPVQTEALTMTMTMTAVAIAGDSRMTRAGIEQVLGRSPGLRVVASVASAGELGSLGVAADVVVWDQGLGRDEDPVEVVEALAAEAAVLVICGPDDADLLALLRAGASGLMTRHTGDGEFLAAVEAVAGGAVFLAAGLAGELCGELRKRRLGEPGVLSRREIETLRLIAEGCTHRQIARRLGLTEMTVNTYVKRIRGKLSAGNKAELTRKAIDLGYARAGGHGAAAAPRRLAAVEPVGLAAPVRRPA